MADLRLTTRDARTGAVRLRIPPGRATPVSGLEQLAQQFSFLLLKTQGAEASAPHLGGGIRNMIGSNEDGARGLAMNAVQITEQQLRSAQAAAKNTRGRHELLRNANLASVTIDTVDNVVASVVTEIFSVGAGETTAGVTITG